jgi:biotin carboxyl carrier protein
MPGIVRRVQVKQGDHVKKGDPLAILEAMKMENEITAEADGIIRTVQVTEGMTVNGGDALVVIGPA